MASLARASLTALALLVCTSAGLAAQEGGGGISLPVLIFTSWTMWPLIVLSIVGVSMAIQRMITITPDIMVPPGLADDMHNIFAEGVNDEACEDAINAVAGDTSMLGEILVAGLDKKDFGYDSMVEAAENTATAELNKYMTQINWLSLFAAIGPMLGLLGTVVGMIGAFFKMAAAGGQVDAALLADQIGSAMLTTATGLLIAIPMLFVFFFLRSRINRSALEAGVLAAEILDYFRPAK
ncbi:MAG: MotA/TolQ/ExbB proton channel family protein [Planctomycetota bacterium]|nr:MAG: MotA/TolQ/ExbB proton channel family protein [Planctomycetota bacterium]